MIIDVPMSPPDALELVAEINGTNEVLYHSVSIPKPYFELSIFFSAQSLSSNVLQYYMNLNSRLQTTDYSVRGYYVTSAAYTWDGTQNQPGIFLGTSYSSSWKVSANVDGSAITLPGANRVFSTRSAYVDNAGTSIMLTTMSVWYNSDQLSSILFRSAQSFASSFDIVILGKR